MLYFEKDHINDATNYDWRVF